MENESYRRRLVDAVESLIEMCILETMFEKQISYGKAKLSDFLPTEKERQECLDTLVMASDLATGEFSHKKKGERSSLTALARSLIFLAAVPGGVKSFGIHWELVCEDGIVRMEKRDV